MGGANRTKTASGAKESLYIIGLGNSDLNQQPSSRIQELHRGRHKFTVKIEAVKSAVKCRARIEIPYLRLKVFYVTAPNIRGVGNNHVESAPLQRFKE